MGKSLRSKRMRANRIRKRIVNRPKELAKLKQALSFEYNEETENAHLSMFNDIVNGPLPGDGTYFEPSITVLEKSQQRYENFLSRKIPKVAEIASKNLQRPIGSPKREEDDNTEDQERVDKVKKVKDVLPDNVVLENECQPSKSGSWPKWMNQRSIKKAAKARRKMIKRCVNRERRMNKDKKNSGTKLRKVATNQDVEMADL